MTSVVMGEFKGMIPGRSNQLIPDGFAALVYNMRVDGDGRMRGFRALRHEITFTGRTQPIGRIYRVPDPSGPLWIISTDHNADIVRSGLKNDGYNRYYVCEPGNPLTFTTPDRIRSGFPPYPLGVPAPIHKPVAKLSVASDFTALGYPAPTTPGGPNLGNTVNRYYCYTYSNAWGEESAPSKPSAQVVCKDDNNITVNVTPIPTAQQDANQGKTINIYRTEASETGVADFFLVETGLSANTTKFLDVATGTTGTAGWEGAGYPTGWQGELYPPEVVTLNATIQSAGWGSPPADADGIVVLAGGILLAYKGKDIYVSESYRWHTFPPAFQMSTKYPIVGAAAVGNSVVFGTEGGAEIVTGVSPDALAMAIVADSEPCQAKRSVVAAIEGVYYASPTGLILVNSNTAVHATRTLVTDRIWLDRYLPASMIAIRWRGMFLAIGGVSGGFGINSLPSRTGPGENASTALMGSQLSMVELPPMAAMTALDHDEQFDQAWVALGDTIYEWDGHPTASLPFMWRTKEYTLLDKVNFGAFLLDVENGAETTISYPDVPELQGIDWDHENFGALTGSTVARVKVWANRVLRTTLNIDEDRIYRLPSGFKSNTWQFEIAGRQPVQAIRFAETARELNGEKKENQGGQS
jgi:hypothetical protein